jgi:hypothetical protein
MHVANPPRGNRNPSSTMAAATRSRGTAVAQTGVQVVKARVFAHEAAAAPESRCLERDLQTASAWLTAALSEWNRRLSFAVTIGISFQRRFARRFRERFSRGGTTRRSPWSPKPITIWTTTERHAGHDAGARQFQPAARSAAGRYVAAMENPAW